MELNAPRSFACSFAFAAASARPFLHSREMIVIAMTRRESDIGARRIGTLRVAKLIEQLEQLRFMFGDEIAKTHILRLDPEQFASARAANRHISGALRLAALRPF